MHTHAYTRIHTHTHAYPRIHTHTHAYTRIHTHTHAYTRIHTHTHAYTRIHTHTHAYTRIHTHTHAHAQATLNHVADGSRKQERETQSCDICNDRATGLHYGIVSCEGLAWGCANGLACVLR